MRETGCDAVGVNQELAYQLEMYPGDLVEITTRVLKIGERSMRFRHEMRNAGTGELAATCVMTAAYLDRRSGKSTPWPPEVRQAAAERPQAEPAAT
jgi:acyl-CoA thioester hydrolase